MDASFIGERVKQAMASKTPLAVHGGNTKAFYGGVIVGEPLDVRPYTGIIEYEPKELVLTVRAGTALSEIEAAMDAAAQMLPFEPPHYGTGNSTVTSTGATIGGTVATGLSGPRRSYTGAVRDFVLGARIIDGKGDDMRFGGRVIKNVAGYDVSRLMTGALGTLGVLLDLSFKVLPKPAVDVTLRHEMDEATAIRQFNEWAGKPLPISATSWHEGVAMLRLSGASAGVKAARQRLGGDIIDDAIAGVFWRTLRDQRDAFFSSVEPLWRVSVPSTSPPLALMMPQWIEWGGGLRWHRGTADVSALRTKVAAVGGHVTLFRNGEKSVGVFHPLQPALKKIHRDLKLAFDPENILNRGRMDNF